MDTSSGGGTTGEVTEVIKDAAGLEFQRGKLKLDDNGLVFAPSINDSKLMDMASTYISIGPIDPVKLVYSPYETSFQDAERYDGYQEISYSSIEAVSVVQKGKVSEVAIDSDELPDSVYLRFRVDVGTYFWPVYNGNKKYAKKIGEEILENAKSHGGAEEFKAGGVYSGPTSSVDMS
jgi:hypothetical protein